METVRWNGFNTKLESINCPRCLKQLSLDTEVFYHLPSREYRGQCPCGFNFVVPRDQKEWEKIYLYEQRKEPIKEIGVALCCKCIKPVPIGTGLTCPECLEKEKRSEIPLHLETLSTGAKIESTGNRSCPHYFSPFAMLRIGKRLNLGATKYPPWNYVKGLPIERRYESATRHLFQWASGEVDEDHLSAAVANLMFIIHTEECVKRGLLPESLSDMPKWNKI